MSRNQNTRIEDFAGFYGSKQYSPNRQFCVSFIEGHYNDNIWEDGAIALISSNELLFKKQLQRPNDCFVSNDGTVTCCDWLNSDEIKGRFIIFEASGKELFSIIIKANLGISAISDNSEFAVFETHNSNTNDGNSIYIVDVKSKKIIKKFERPISFTSAKIDASRNLLILKDYNGFLFELDFEGAQTNKNEYENQILDKGSLYEKLLLYTNRPNVAKLKDQKYLELLTKALTDKDVLYSFGIDRIYRILGEYYEANDNIELTIKYWENALTINPKIGIKRKLNVIKNKITGIDKN